MITRTFAIRKKETHELLKLNIDVEFWGDEDNGYQTETNYDIETYGDLPVWETTDIINALSVIDCPHSYRSIETPSLSCVKADEVEIVTIDRFNNSCKIISADNVPQTIFEFVKDMYEFINVFHLNDDGTVNEKAKFDLIHALHNYSEKPNDYRINSYQLSKVYKVLEAKGVIKEIPTDYNKIREELNKSLELLDSLDL